MSPDRVPAPISIAHIGLRTRNPDKLVAFYQNLLGARVVLANDYISVLTWDEEHHRLAIIHDAAAVPKQPNSSGVDHIALQFASVKDLVQVYRQAKDAGIAPDRCINHGVSTSLYYTDPDGNKIEALIEAYDDPEDVQRHMGSLDAANIRVVRFNPEELRRRVEAGEDNESLRGAGLLGPPPAGIPTSAILAGR
ncbi:biphenyl-2,3-diol 1,2-dioxygenase 2 [Colletotrichum musicola]|uniref:Biphenyl-2,3-diol 1,2-dioxygenase 2 n=1 Tax=Colletotrichum musicola TaxID=2175873 RepID=A0A8H6KHM1_9PEZI|nr:biphenyl-2,3-diol 1,2-dioxygenase 2 [Colletotrichum musicola]